MGDSGAVMDVDRQARGRAEGNGAAAGARLVAALMLALSAVFLPARPIPFQRGNGGSGRRS